MTAGQTPKQVIDEDLLRAQQAGAILDSQVFKDAVQKTEANIIEKWRHGSTPQTREAAHAELMALDGVLAQLGTIVDDGEVIRTRAARRGRTSQTEVN